MDPISLEDLALLEVLQRVDQHVVLTDNDKFPMGNLVAGDQYNVHLNDPKFPTPWESTYANQLLVVDNP